MKKKKTKKCLLISGGGSWGAFGGGTLSRLDNNYDTVIGISTGALMSPFVALNEWKILKLAYTSITGDDIFDNYWYKPKPVNEHGKIKKLPIIISLIVGDKSISTSRNLKKLINEFFEEAYFNNLKVNNKEILVGTQNYAENPSRLHFFSSMEENFEDFKDWMWASANVPFFTSLINKTWKDKQGNFHVGQWTDGGLTELVKLDLILRDNYDEVDILIHREKKQQKHEGFEVKTLIENVVRGIDAMRFDIEFENFYDKIKYLNWRGVTVRVYWLPWKIKENPLCFNKKLMLKWWEEGYDTALDSSRVELFPPMK